MATTDPGARSPRAGGRGEPLWQTAGGPARGSPTRPAGGPSRPAMASVQPEPGLRA
jgi:hypothetical protein